MTAFFGDAIRWSYRRSPSVFRKPDRERAAFRVLIEARSRPDSDRGRCPEGEP